MPAGRAGCWTCSCAPISPSTGLIYLSYAEPRDGSQERHQRGQGASSSTDGDGGRLERRAGDLPAGAGVCLQRTISARASSSRRDGSLFVTLGERYSARDEAQNPANHLGKLVRIMPDGSPYAGNPEEGRLAAGDLVDRPPQRAGRGAQSRDRQAVDHRARRARRRRDQHPRGRQELRLAGDHLRPRLHLRQDRRGHAQGRHGAADLLLGPLHRPLGRGLLHRRPASRNGRATCSSARWRARRCTASCSTARRSWARRRCSPTSASASATCASGPDGALWLLTDNPEGRVLRVVPQ